MGVVNIRQSVFETNSSSCHVLCVNKDKNIKVPDVLYITYGGEYGWQKETYSDPDSCGEYFYQILKDVAWDNGKRDFENSGEFSKYDFSEDQYWWFYPEKYPEYKVYKDKAEEDLKKQVENIMAGYGCSIVWVDPKTKKIDYYTYIDHISELHDFFNDLMSCPELLVNFLCGNAAICTGNDNDDYSYPDSEPGYDYYFEKGN